jgi:hypothetical protein
MSYYFGLPGFYRTALKYFSFLIISALFALALGCGSSSEDEEVDETNQTEDLVETEYPAEIKTGPDTVFHEIASVEKGLALFEELNYTPERWREGIREIPRLNVLKISNRWRNQTSKEIEVRLKKQIFFQ